MSGACPRNCRTKALPGLRRAGWLLLGVTLLAPLADLQAAQEGRFEVRSANSIQLNGVWYVNARIDYRLSRQAEEALSNGITLGFRMELELQRVRWYWFDPNVVELRQEYQLSYQPVTQLYVLRNPDSGNQTSYSSLFAALNGLGRVTSLALIDGSLLAPDQEYVVWLRVALDRQKLPASLRLLSYWTGGLGLESDWYEWPLER